MPLPPTRCCSLHSFSSPTASKSKQFSFRFIKDNFWWDGLEVMLVKGLVFGCRPNCAMNGHNCFFSVFSFGVVLQLYALTLLHKSIKICNLTLFTPIVAWLFVLNYHFGSIITFSFLSRLIEVELLNCPVPSLFILLPLIQFSKQHSLSMLNCSADFCALCTPSCFPTPLLKRPINLTPPPPPPHPPPNSQVLGKLDTALYVNFFRSCESHSQR